MRLLLFSSLEFASRVLNRLARLALASALRWKPAGFQERRVISSTKYDMMRAVDEPYYAEQYWSCMLPYLRHLPTNARGLDLGCGQGRFAVKLGCFFDGGEIFGCDLSHAAIVQAREYAVRETRGNVDFQVRPIDEFLKAFGANTIDVIVMTEVTFFYPEWQHLLPRIVQILKPGGLVFISFRSQYFNGLCLARGRLWEEVDTLLNERQGAIFGSLTAFAWETSREIGALLSEGHGLELLELRGIGACSGIPGDPHDQICRPSELSCAERKQLMRLEMELGRTVPDSGRYILAVGRKPVPKGWI